MRKDLVKLTRQARREQRIRSRREILATMRFEAASWRRYAKARIDPSLSDEDLEWIRREWIQDDVGYCQAALEAIRLHGRGRVHRFLKDLKNATI